MRLSRADPANCVRAVLNFVLRRWLWLMPNPTTACFLRETEISCNHCLLMPAWAWTLCEYFILQCWVIPAKDISSACNWFVYIYKNLIRNWSSDACALHRVQPEPCSLSWGLGGMMISSASGNPWPPCIRAGCAVFTKVTGCFIADGVEVCFGSEQLAPLTCYCISQATTPFCGFMCLA